MYITTSDAIEYLEDYLSKISCFDERMDFMHSLLHGIENELCNPEKRVFTCPEQKAPLKVLKRLNKIKESIATIRKQIQKLQ